MDDLISRKAAIDALGERPMVWSNKDEYALGERSQYDIDRLAIETVPSAQPERLTDDDFETIRIHLNAIKENLCNQQRWKEAEDYQRLIDRFMAFASAQPEPLTDKEQRIFLAAMRREEKVCEEVDRNYVREPYEDSLMSVCREITRKVKGALWT